jgi:MFS family permease
MPAFIKQFGHGDGPLAILSARDVSVMTAVPTVGSLFGAWISAYCGDKLGRKKTLLVGCVISIIAAAIQTASSSIAVITVGRSIACEFSAMLFG